MTNNEIIVELIKHDGWKSVVASGSMVSYYDPKSRTRGAAYKRYCSVSIDAQLEEHWLLRPYLTDIRILHRMAIKVVDEAKEMLYNSDDFITDLTDIRLGVISAMFKDKNESGEYLDLATSLVEAIRFINQHKTNG